MASLAGYETKRGLFLKVESGEMYNRKGNETQNSGRSYSLAGEKSKTANLETLNRAKEMEENGNSRDEIYNETGWVKGKDDKWRYEIPDNLDKINFATLRNSISRGYGMCMLPDIYKNKQLYAAYPFLEDVFVITSETEENNRYQKNDYGELSIHINIEDVKRKKMSPKDKAVLLHEIQHAIQDYEGFVGGTSLKGAKQYRNNEIAVKRRELEAQGHYDEAEATVEEQRKILQTPDYEFFDDYMNFGGEQEAREVAIRAEKRKQKKQLKHL